MAEKWLVIDDSATIQRVIKLAFQDYDVAITEADSIQDALRELAKSPSSLVIADAALAGVQSVQDFSRLQHSSPQSAFIILEGSYDHIEESQFRNSGFRHFLKKPFDAQQLISITREALGRAIPTRFDPSETTPPPPALKPFSFLDDEGKAPPPLPGIAPRSLHEELENPFGNTDGFDLGLAQEPEPKSRFSRDPIVSVERAANPSVFSAAQSEAEPSFRPKVTTHLTHEELFDTSQIRAKPYHAEPEIADEPIERVSASSFTAEPSYQPKREPSYNPAALSGMLEPMLRDEMEKIVRQTVEDYCRKNFADLAREYLSREIEKLSSERARLLVDK